MQVSVLTCHLDFALLATAGKSSKSFARTIYDGVVGSAAEQPPPVHRPPMIGGYLAKAPTKNGTHCLCKASSPTLSEPMDHWTETNRQPVCSCLFARWIPIYRLLTPSLDLFFSFIILSRLPNEQPRQDEQQKHKQWAKRAGGGGCVGGWPFPAAGRAACK